MSSRASDAPSAAAGSGHSLRGRLIALVLAAVAIGSAAQAVTAYRSALRSADAVLDMQLQVLARSIESAGPGEVRGYGVQIYGPNGELLFEGGHRRLPQRAVIGFADEMVDGTRMRIYTLQSAQRTIRIAQDLDERMAQARRIAAAEVLPSVAAGLLLMLAVWFVIDRSLAPIDRLRRQVAARAPDDLEPLPESGLPREVQPLVGELNELFARVRAAFESQQRFVSDAAHELRSPLTALRLQLAALRREPQGAARDAAAARLEEGITRAIALVTQLLALAREEAAPVTARQAVALEALCRDAVADVLPLAHARGIDIGLEPAAPGLAISGEPEGLRTLLRNLLENAVKYTPEHGRVDVLLAQDAARTSLTVEDSGPGIPEDERAHVFEPFRRAASAGDVPGSGLGLAIVQAIARRHGARVRLDRSARLGGLAVHVDFPRDGAGRMTPQA